ncbi:glycosyltransferase [Flavobacterium sp.]|jgi:cellulose synthase/poly-beta-1,6-N-acetylglucosamine synthase-like glycosyltransferase|uniref:glycosyltransferase family 2 protein n=1 Tax=Flavobacterium sp. TaxID=239 RepID=UPI0037C03298
MTLVLFFILSLYILFIAQLIYGFNKLESYEKTEKKPITAFSIIVPFRNEEKNLPKLLKSISNLNYPVELLEIILVDDFSTDASERICINWRLANGLIESTLLENLRLSNSPKKDAISRAIPIVKNKWIITTDADCIVPKNWLQTLDNFIQNKQPEMVVGAVVYKTKNNWFHHFQQLDLMSLQGTTIGSFGLGKPFMCNGANFAYTKNLFQEIGGFSGINNTASGDDVLLLQKAIAYTKDKVCYLKNEDFIVKTKPINDFYELFIQRVRWASKTSSYQTNYPKLLAVIVLAMNVSLVVSFGLWYFGKFDLRLFAMALILKYGIDYVLLYKTNGYLRNKALIPPLASSLFYPIFSSFVGIYSLFGSFNWKGRKFKK